jgi:hypothetical protein
MQLVFNKVPVKVSRFFKSIVPIFKEYKEFKSIKTNIVNYNIIYQLNGVLDTILFYKKANLNAYNRFKNNPDYTQLERLRSDIIPKRIKHTDENHDFAVYLADEFVFVVYSKDNRSPKDSWTWDIWLYDTKNKNWSQYSRTFYKSFGGIYGFYYLRKCRKAIFAVGNPIFSDEVFHKDHDTRRGFKLNDFYFISLDKPRNDLSSYGYIYMGSHLEEYIKDQYANKYEQILHTNVDYTVDVNNGVVYMICKVKLHADGEYKVNILTLEYDMCANSVIRDFGVEMPTPIVEDFSGGKNILLYLSTKRLRDKGMPKYLPMHISSEFYDFMSNKLFHADMIFSSHSQLFVKDRHFNRVDAVLAKIESLKFAAHIPLQENIITMRNGRNNKLLAALIMNDLAVVNHRTKFT